MANYEIKKNPQFNSLEVYFTGKPDEATRNNLKALKFRWNNKKMCWYGFAEVDQVKTACEGGKVETAGTKAPKATTKKVNKYGVKVGDFFVASWGYEQTNVDFFQVIALVGETSVRIREVHPPIIDEDRYSAMAADRTYNLDKTKILEPASYSVFVKDQENGDIKRVSDKYTNHPHIIVGRSEQIAELVTTDTTKTYESWYY